MSPLIPAAGFGADGNVAFFPVLVAPEVCTVAGKIGDWWLESVQSPNVTTKVTVAIAPAGGGFFTSTPIVFTLPPGSVFAQLAMVLPVSAGDRLIASCDSHWNHGGLTLRGRLKA